MRRTDCITVIRVTKLMGMAMPSTMNRYRKRCSFRRFRESTYEAMAESRVHKSTLATE